MCMLYGFSANKKYNLEPTLKEFFKKSIYHPDGWGIGIYEGSNAKVYKEPEKAVKSPNINDFKKVSTDLCIAHIRKATRGKITYENTHPFTRIINNKQWIFAHNGTIISSAFDEMRLDTEGSTDSEKAFEYIKSTIEQKQTFKTMIKSMENAVEYLAENGKFNMLMSDGEYLFVHTNTKGTLYLYEKNGLICFSTNMLEKVKDNQAWIPVPLNRLMVYREGKTIHIGRNHMNECKRLTKRYK